MIYSDTRFVALHLFTRARASQSDFAGVASVLQPLARLGFPPTTARAPHEDEAPTALRKLGRAGLLLAAIQTSSLQASPSSCARPARACKRFARPIEIDQNILQKRQPTGTCSTHPAKEHELPAQKAAAKRACTTRRRRSALKQQDGLARRDAPARVRPQHRKTAAADARAVVPPGLPRLSERRRCRRERRRPRYSSGDLHVWWFSDTTWFCSPI